jgi:hypothetical protein
MDSYMAQLEPAIAKLEELNRMDSLSDSIATARTKCYDLRNEIIDKQGQISEIVSPILLEPFLLKPGDPVIEFEILTTETDDGQLPMVVYSPAQKIEGQKFPCVVWLHGGSIDSNLSDKDTTLHIEAPDQITSPFNWDQTEHNVSLWLQPLIRFLVSNGVVVATIEMDPKEGNGNLCQQIKDQATIIKGLPHVDPAQTTFFGHSAGGYALSLLLANDHQFLIDNFKSIAFVSPVSNEAWSGGLYPSQYTKQEDVQDTAQRCLDLNKDCYFNFAFPEEEALPRTSIAGKRIGDHKIGDLLKRPECAQFVLEHVYPFSPTCGMSDEQLKPKLALLPQLFILMGTADNNTIPATQGGTLAWRLKEMELTNWCMRIYPNAHHSPHRLKTCYGNPPSKEGFRQMLPDILSIAKGPYPTGTRELSDLSNGGTDVCDMTGQANTMRSFAKRSFFVRRDSGNNAIEFVLFEGTESGREILEATEEKDRIPTVSWPEE